VGQRAHRDSAGADHGGDALAELVPRRVARHHAAALGARQPHAPAAAAHLARAAVAAAALVRGGQRVAHAGGGGACGGARCG
jgi:hypothetical protein